MRPHERVRAQEAFRVLEHIKRHAEVPDFSSEINADATIQNLLREVSRRQYSQNSARQPDIRITDEKEAPGCPTDPHVLGKELHKYQSRIHAEVLVPCRIHHVATLPPRKALSDQLGQVGLTGNRVPLDEYVLVRDTVPLQLCMVEFGGRKQALVEVAAKIIVSAG